MRRLLVYLTHAWTVGALAMALRWDYALTDSWVHQLRRRGLVAKVGEVMVRDRRGHHRRVGVYQRVFDEGCGSRDTGDALVSSCCAPVAAPASASSAPVAPS
jgi:hypothetical protein